MKGQGWKVILTQWRNASDILTSTLAAFLFSSHPKKERDRQAHLNYYASADNGKTTVAPQDETKPNTTKCNHNP